MKRKLLTGAAVVLSAVLAVGVYFLDIYSGHWRIATEEETLLFIPTGSDMAAVRESLSAIVPKINVLDKSAKVLKWTTVKPGRYLLSEGMTYFDLVRKLRNGNQDPLNVTFNNIRTIPQLAGVLARQLEPDSVALVEYLTHDTLAAYYGFKPETLIAMFIPNTYEFYWNTSLQGITNRFKREYDLFWTPQREAKLAEVGLSKIEVAILASIVNGESLMVDEMPTIAGAYINRLKINMKLQADPTVIFGIGDFSISRVLHSHLEYDSPYNTYKYGGLPPGPICMPTVAAIDAVLNYGRHNYIFFCAKDDFSGYHSFAVTYSEHLRNAAAYQRALNARDIR